METELSRWMSLAGESWEDAAYLIRRKTGYRSAVSRAYYAMFYATQAVLLTQGLHAKSHSGTLHVLNQHFVRPGLFPSDAYRLLSIAFQARQVGDYDPFSSISEQEAVTAVEQSERFIYRVLRCVSRKPASWAGRTNSPA
jgi:uncharacterized protein (UPF0332 family)